MKAAGGIKPSTATAPQPIFAEDVVHLLDARDALEGDAGVEQTLEINFVRVFLQEENVLPHDEAPDGMIDRGVFVVALVDGELQEMFRAGRATAALFVRGFRFQISFGASLLGEHNL